MAAVKTELEIEQAYVSMLYERLDILRARAAERVAQALRPDEQGGTRAGDGTRLPPMPAGSPGIGALQAAAGVGYGEGFAGNAHRFAPTGMLAAVKFLIEEAHLDVNAVDDDGNTVSRSESRPGDDRRRRLVRRSDCRSA